MQSSIGLLVADIHGSIHVLDRTFEIQNSWIVHQTGRVTHMIENRGILVTLGVSWPPVSSKMRSLGVM
jgi:hypothetical protein